jgi:hypothetical protein
MPQFIELVVKRDIFRQVEGDNADAFYDEYDGPNESSLKTIFLKSFLFELKFENYLLISFLLFFND